MFVPLGSRRKLKENSLAEISECWLRFQGPGSYLGFRSRGLGLWLSVLSVFSVSESVAVVAMRPALLVLKKALSGFLAFSFLLYMPATIGDYESFEPHTRAAIQTNVPPDQNTQPEMR